MFKKGQDWLVQYFWLIISDLLLENRDWESVFLYKIYGLLWFVSTHHLIVLLPSIWVPSLYLQKEEDCPLLSSWTYLFWERFMKLWAQQTRRELRNHFFIPFYPQNQKTFTYALRWCSHCNLYYILINYGLCPFRKLQIQPQMSYNRVFHVPHKLSIQYTNNCL